MNRLNYKNAQLESRSSSSHGTNFLRQKLRGRLSFWSSFFLNPDQEKTSLKNHLEKNRIRTSSRVSNIFFPKDRIFQLDKKILEGINKTICNCSNNLLLKYRR